MQEQLLLSISILVSNRIDTIRKCLESIKPLLEALPSELIIVDTVGEEKSDGSLAIAKEYTSQIVHFDWCNDFSAARNAGLERASGLWFMFIDDDEWFDDVVPLIAFLESEESEQYGRGIFNIKNFSDDTKYSLNVVERIVKRTKHTKFVGLVHEQLTGIQGKRKSFPCHIHHVGYVYRSLEEKKAHQERNVSILTKELRERGKTPRIVAQMVQEYLVVEDTKQKGIKLAKESLELWRGSVEETSASAQWIISAIARIYAGSEEREELHKWIAYVKEKYQCSPLTKLVLSEIEADAAVKEQNYILAQEGVINFIAQRDWLVAHEEEKERMIQLDLPTYLSEEYYVYMLYVGVFSANRLKDYQTAMIYWNRFPWTSVGVEKEQYKAELGRTVFGIRQELKWKKVLELKECIDVGDYTEGLFLAKQIEEMPGNVTEINLVLAGLMIEAASKRNDSGKVLEYAGLYLTSWNQFRQSQQNTEFQSEVEVAIYLEESKILELLYLIATHANKAQEFKTAYKCWELFPWERPMLKGEIYLEEMKKTLNGLEQLAFAQEDKGKDM